MKTNYTKESALKRIAKKGCHADERNVIQVPYGPGVGNGTLGAIDYLCKNHRYVAVKK